LNETFFEEKQMETKQRIDTPERNPDPITKAPGSHPLGTGVGAAAGGAAGIGAAVATGAVLGTVVGPVGTAAGAVVGAALGAVAGGLVGKGVAEQVNPTIEEAYWRENFASRPYVTPGTSHDDYGPAYRYGWESRGRYSDKGFDEVDGALERDWGRAKGKSRLTWAQAKAASRDAWDRIEAGNTHACGARCC
jgi:hypothetical protein